MDNIIEVLKANNFEEFFFDMVREGDEAALSFVSRLSEEFHVSTKEHNRIKKTCKNGVRVESSSSTDNPFEMLRRNIVKNSFEGLDSDNLCDYDSLDILDLIKEDLKNCRLSLIIRCHIGKKIMLDVTKEKKVRDVCSSIFEKDQSRYIATLIKYAEFGNFYFKYVDLFKFTTLKYSFFTINVGSFKKNELLFHQIVEEAKKDDNTDSGQTVQTSSTNDEEGHTSCDNDDVDENNENNENDDVDD